MCDSGPLSVAVKAALRASEGRSVQTDLEGELPFLTIVWRVEYFLEKNSRSHNHGQTTVTTITYLHLHHRHRRP
jgi:hypothetical protein